MQKHLVRLVLTATAIVFLHAAAAVAQNTCQSFKALAQATLVLDPNSLPPDLAVVWNTYPVAWGGNVYGAAGTIGATAPRSTPLTGWFYGSDSSLTSNPPSAGGTGASGRGKDGFYMFAFGTYDGTTWNITDSFTVQLGQAVWTPNPSGFGNFGAYQASGKLIDGTGMFQDASGSFTLQGDFFYHGINVPPGFIAAWNPSLIGTFCK